MKSFSAGVWRAYGSMRLLIELDVSEVGIRAGGLDTDGEKLIVALSIVHDVRNRLHEIGLVGDDMVTGGHRHHGFGVLAHQLVCGVGYAGRRISLERLEEDVLFRYAIGLCQSQFAILFRSDDEDVFAGDDAYGAVYGHLQQSAAGAKDVYELFWSGVSAQRPETAACTARHYDTISVVLHYLSDSLPKIINYSEDCKKEAGVLKKTPALRIKIIIRYSSTWMFAR